MGCVCACVYFCECASQRSVTAERIKAWRSVCVFVHGFKVSSQPRYNYMVLCSIWLNLWGNCPIHIAVIAIVTKRSLFEYQPWKLSRSRNQRHQICLKTSSRVTVCVCVCVCVWACASIPACEYVNSSPVLPVTAWGRGSWKREKGWERKGGRKREERDCVHSAGCC